VKFSALFSTLLPGTLLLSSMLSMGQTATAVRWTEGAPDNTSEVRNDNKIEGLTANDVHIFVSIADIKETEYNRVWVQLTNHGKTPLNFDPQAAILLNGDKTVRAEVPDKAANSIQKKGEAKSQQLSSANCTIRMSGQTTGGVGENCTPNNTQMQMSKQVAAFSTQQAQWVRDNGLMQKDIAPGQEAQGVIVFKKDKKPTDYILRIPVGSQVLEFPLSAQNKAPSY
jgi:hypothetical protein